MTIRTIATRFVSLAGKTVATIIAEILSTNWTRFHFLGRNDFTLVIGDISKHVFVRFLSLLI